MKIIFMGTPEFAIPSLKILLESPHDVVAVVSAPDKEKGRGKQISFTPVKEFAIKNNLEVLTPVELKDETFIRRLKELQPDLFVVVAFRILPKEVYTIPLKGSFNLHGSLLPKFRGAAPIQWAIIKGEKETGVTSFFLEDKVDTGNIILQEKLKIDDSDDFGSLHDKMMVLGAEVVARTVDMIAGGDINTSKQNDSLASPAPKIRKEICRIDWSKDASGIHNLVRGLSPNPCAYFTHEEKNYKVYKTELIKNKEFNMEYEFKENSPFSIVSLSPGKQGSQLIAKTGNGLLKILELQPEGRKRMTTEEFLRGYTFLK